MSLLCFILTILNTTNAICHAKQYTETKPSMSYNYKVSITVHYRISSIALSVFSPGSKSQTLLALIWWDKSCVWSEDNCVYAHYYHHCQVSDQCTGDLNNVLQHSRSPLTATVAHTSSQLYTPGNTYYCCKIFIFIIPVRDTTGEDNVDNDAINDNDESGECPGPG